MLSCITQMAEKTCSLSWSARAWLISPIHYLDGQLNDVYFTKYIHICEVLLHHYHHELHPAYPCRVLFLLIGIGLFERIAIQFGMDQMLETSSDQLSTFITDTTGVVTQDNRYVLVGVLIYFSQCSIKLNIQDIIFNISQYLAPYEETIMYTLTLFMGVLQLVCACAGLCLLVQFNREFNINQTGQHPLKLIYRVLRYDWNHTCPENHSAFTYQENDIPQLVLTLAKKYGGPFTAEEVEDTKTLLRILLLLLSLLGFHLSGHGYSVLDQLMRRQCPSFYCGVLVAETMHIPILIVITGVPVYQLISACCWQRYLSNMLKRTGLGLLCCLSRRSSIIMIIQSTMTGSHCKHVDSMQSLCFLLLFAV